jgi:hypothetical protein
LTQGRLYSCPQQEETALATELKVGDRFFDELKQEVVVEEVHEGYVACRLTDGVISLVDIPKLRI